MSPVRELRQFAQGIERGRAASTAARPRPESNERNRRLRANLKLIKREMYVQTTFDVLRS
ncbi:hypothetical protein [Ktedonobacter racemifer]|uniref:Transposase IS204/IS1001/IS1096/IS1165 family protein n=1 Tax=Ktedonobacter racemifer DSM 44963 TaxID=485913 RepID=D6U8A4_KTERA|nr:hypothetical protein [Ktedonobacter racemifer]EFH80115.1 transposase IS204/IS1001/IS1096/IS1165 family protein [Ktedonobacter racemifer DSM 44963]